MRYFILTLSLFVSSFCLAQNWAENNAVWHYEQINIQPPFNDDFIKFSSIGDTVILGKQTKIILEERINLNDTIANEIFMRSDSNRVYLFDSFSNSFKLIYNFNALPGDTIEVFCPERISDSTTTIVVDSVSTINVNGNILGVQYVSPLIFGNYDMTGMIIENIGWTGFMFPLSTISDPPYGGELRCFQNDSIGLYKPSAFDCDYLETGIESINNTNNFSSYPNPAHEIIQISITKDVDLTRATISLVDVSGREVLNQHINSKETTIHINHLPNGIYFSIIRLNNETFAFKKIMVIN